ncbi:MAG: hypothetical protein ABL864_10265 [Terricaulis sp.]|jgi:ABC-type oligopeptide transport system substrate-binding subunit
MTKFKLALAASAAAILAFGVAACGQTTATTEEPAAIEDTTVEPAADPAAVDPAAAPADPAAAPADGAAPATTTP